MKGPFLYEFESLSPNDDLCQVWLKLNVVRGILFSLVKGSDLAFEQTLNFPAQCFVSS